MVSAWAGKQHLVLGQEKVSDKSNEITAIPKLLEILELSGSIVTIDETNVLYMRMLRFTLRNRKNAILVMLNTISMSLSMVVMGV
jgi:hypothetical protein